MKDEYATLQFLEQKPSVTTVVLAGNWSLLPLFSTQWQCSYCETDTQTILHKKEISGMVNARVDVDYQLVTLQISLTKFVLGPIRMHPARQGEA